MLPGFYFHKADNSSQIAKGFFSVLFHDRTMCPAQFHRFYRILLLFRGNEGVLNCRRSSRSLSVGAGSPARGAQTVCVVGRDPPASHTVTNTYNKLLPQSCSGSCYVFPHFPVQKIAHQRLRASKAWHSADLWRLMGAHTRNRDGAPDK